VFAFSVLKYLNQSALFTLLTDIIEWLVLNMCELIQLSTIQFITFIYIKGNKTSMRSFFKLFDPLITGIFKKV